MERFLGLEIFPVSSFTAGTNLSDIIKFKGVDKNKTIFPGSKKTSNFL